MLSDDAPTFKEGDEYWFGFSLFVDEETTTSSWCVAVQWKNDGTGSPPLEFVLDSNEGFQIQGGFGHPSGNRNHTRTVPGGFTTGVFNKWVIHVKFASDPAQGWYEVYENDELVLPKFSPPGGTLYPGLDSYHKHGLYCDAANSGVRTVWQDDWRIGTSYDAVAPR